jgi:inactivated superfamily I helicase
MPLGLSRTTASAITMAVVLPGFALLWRAAHRRGFNVEPLALLALLGVLRTVCDSTHLEYYYEAALIPLVVWETCGARRLPVLSACAMAAVAASFGVGSTLAPALLNVLSIGLSCALATHLARRSFFASPVRQAVKAEQRPGLGRILGSRLRAVHPLSS